MDVDYSSFSSFGWPKVLADGEAGEAAAEEVKTAELRSLIRELKDVRDGG